MRRGSISLVLAVGLLAPLNFAGPVLAAPPVTKDESVPPAPLTPAEQASAQARSSGQRVEVVAERTENELVFANPSGTFTSETTVGPQRVEQADGSWVDVDPTLYRRPDGSIGPKASTVELSFAGAGSTDLVRFGDDGKSMIIGWPQPLKAPTLDGPVATYPEVLPGVDLKMRATTVGYSYVMVVKNGEAETISNLARLRLTVRGEGVDVREGANGGLDAIDATGATIFSGAEPTMWDSTRPASPAPAKIQGGRSAAREATDPAQPAPVQGPTSGDITAAPAPSSKVAEVGLSLTGDGALTLVPDAEMLKNPETTYPVYIDPDASATIKKSDWTYVSSDFPSTEYHNFDDDKGMGRCSNWGGYLCDSNPYTNRMYFKFKPVEKDWNERVVKDVTFRAYETWSFSCTASWVNLRHVNAAEVDSATNWNNRPDKGNSADLMVDRKVAYGRGSSCDPDAPPSFVEFSDNKEETNENLTNTVKAKLAAGAEFAFSLTAADETDGNSWKRFNGSKSTLVVEYNTRPGKPYGEKTIDPNMPCVAGANRPFLWNDQPTLVVNAKDPDSENISVNFALTDTATAKTYEAKIGPKAHTDGNGKAVDFKVNAGAPLVHGHTYKWHARSNDGKLDSLSFSDWCEYSADGERPDAVPAVSSTDFPTDAANKKPGELGKVVFSANGNSDSVYGNDVAYYEWAIGNDNPTNKAVPATLGGDAEATNVSAVAFGPNVLYARSVDRAGNRSELTRYVFRAVRPCEDPAADACAAAAYPLDETAGTTAADGSGKGRTLTLTGVDHVAGQRQATEPTDGAIRFTGGADFATASSVVDTRSGFTVMAWVRPSALASDMTVLSQVGTYGSGFDLGYSSALKRWTFGRHKSDKTGLAAGDLVQAVDGAVEPPVAGEWTQVVGMFNPGNNKMSIYVDGQERGTAVYTGSVWNAAGGLQVGRTRLNDKWVGFLSGDVDDVRVFPGTLDPADIDDLWRKSRP